MDSSYLSQSSFTSQSSSRGRMKPQTIWITFTGYSGEDVKRGLVIFEFTTETYKKEFSRVISTTSTGHFRTPLECTLKVDEEHNFTLHKLESSNGCSLKIDDIKFNIRKRVKPIIHFSLDLRSISRRMAESGVGKVTKTVTSAEGYSVTFDASSFPPSISEEEEVSSISSFVEDDLTSTVTSISYPGIESNESTWSLAATDGSRRTHRALKVRFDSEIHEIPTTQQLQEEIQQALEERSRLSQSVGDLSLQLFQMKHEMRDIKEALQQVTGMFATQSRKLELLKRNESGSSSSKRRRVVLDGNTIAKAYGGGSFRFEGIEIALKHYLNKDVNPIVVISEAKAQEILDDDRDGKYSHERDRLKHLMDRGLLSLIPINNKRGAFIVKYALDRKADIVSNDSFRSLMDSQSSKAEQRKLKAFLTEHRVPFSFIEDHFIPNPQTSALSSPSHSPTLVERSDTM